MAPLPGATVAHPLAVWGATSPAGAAAARSTSSATGARERVETPVDQTAGPHADDGRTADHPTRNRGRRLRALFGAPGAVDGVAVAGSGLTAESAAVAGSAATVRSAAVAGSAATAYSSAVAGSALTLGSTAVAGSVLTFFGGLIKTCIATVACLRCTRCVACVACVDCVDCIGCIGCRGLRGAAWRVGDRSTRE